VEEGLACKMSAEKFFLERTTSPIGECWILEVQHAFVEEGDGREYPNLDHLAGVAERPRLLHGTLQRLPHLRTKVLGILDLLSPKANAQNCGEWLLKSRRKARGPSCAHSDDSTMTVS
jgi:hypothetical protein